MRTTFVWPLAAAKWSGVDPDEPTIGAELSRCLSEYRRGSLVERERENSING